MKPSKKLSRMTPIILLLFLFTINYTVAIGIAPATKEILLNTNQYTYQIKLINDEFTNKEYLVDIQGQLKNMITASTQKIKFTKNDKYKEITITINIPKNSKLPGGKYTNRIIITEKDSDSKNIGAKIGVASKLTLISPYETASLKTRFIIPNFINNEQNTFSIDVTNEGIKKATNCKGLITILGNTNNALDILLENPQNIEPGTTKRYLFSWQPKIPNGNYLAKATIICDQTTKETQKKFNIGTPTIKVLSLSSNEFKLGTINKFNLILQNDWNEKINNVYTDISLLKNKTIILNEQTPTKNIERLGKISLTTYLDTTKLKQGSYEIITTTHYLGKETAEIFNAKIEQNKITINSLTGNVINQGQQNPNIQNNNLSNESNKINLLIILIIIVLMINGIIFYFLFKHKMQQQNQKPRKYKQDNKIKNKNKLRNKK